MLLQQKNKGQHHFSRPHYSCYLLDYLQTFYFLDVEHFYNYNLDSIKTPLNVDVYAKLLKDTGYPEDEHNFLVQGFTTRFDIGYKGSTQRQSRSKNIPFTVGDKEELWSKIMKEVKAECFVGLYDDILFENYIQSPIGLVPKAGNKTRLIFHLSYVFGEGEQHQSLNGSTLKEECSLNYNDLDVAIRCCLRSG